MIETPYWAPRNRIGKYHANRMKGMNMTDAALQAGYSEMTARVAGSKLEPRHKLKIREALEERGVTTRELAGVIQEGIQAVKQGQPDYTERRNYTRLALESMGELDTKSVVAVQIVLPQSAVDPSKWGEE